jgi:hypothetical protein
MVLTDRPARRTNFFRDALKSMHNYCKYHQNTRLRGIAEVELTLDHADLDSQKIYLV